MAAHIRKRTSFTSTAALGAKSQATKSEPAWDGPDPKFMKMAEDVRQVLRYLEEELRQEKAKAGALDDAEKDRDPDLYWSADEISVYDPGDPDDADGLGMGGIGFPVNRRVKASRKARRMRQVLEYKARLKHEPQPEPPTEHREQRRKVPTFVLPEEESEPSKDKDKETHSRWVRLTDMASYLPGRTGYWPEPDLVVSHEHVADGAFADEYDYDSDSTIAVFPKREPDQQAFKFLRLN